METTTNKIDDRRTPWLYDFSVITNPSLLSRPGLMLPYVCHQLKASVTEGFLARSFIVRGETACLAFFFLFRTLGSFGRKTELRTG